MFSFLSVWWMQIIVAFYGLCAVVAFVSALFEKRYLFVLRNFALLSIGVFLVWFGEYTRMHDAVPSFLNIFPPPPSIWGEPVLLTFLSFMISVSIFFFSLGSLGGFLWSLFEEMNKDPLPFVDQCSIASDTGDVPGVRFLYAERSWPQSRVWYERNGAKTEQPLMLNMRNAEFVRDEGWTDEEWKAIQKVAPLIVEQMEDALMYSTTFS